MTIHVVVREEQNEHGFVDAGVVGLFQSRVDAAALVESSIALARREGLRVFGDPGSEPDWDVSWTIESHPLS